MSAPVFPPHPDPLRFWSGTAPGRVAVVDRARGRRLTYGEMDREADRWAAVLRGMGLGRGSLVGVLAGNRAETLALLFACGRVGAALLPLNWRLPAAELGPIVADARPSLLLGEARFHDAAQEALGALPPEILAPRWVDLDAEAPALLAAAGAAGEDVPAAPDDPLLVLYTSGSTGRPKGAVLPHRQLLFNAVATTTAWELGPDDVAPVSTPLFHTGGWNVFATPLLHRGGRLVLHEGFDPDDFLRMMREEGCTVALVVPTQLLMLAERPGWGEPLPALRWLISGGAPCPPALAERVRGAGYAFREGYGLTECGPNCFALSTEEAARRPGAVGRPVPFLEVRLETGDGRDADEGEVGELLLRGPQVFAGYLRDPARTAEVLSPEGWLRTGDLARRGEAGVFSICGRRKEMYISGGENVFPGEVEAVLSGCPGVGEVVVVGVPDPRWGEVGRAFIVPAAHRPPREQDVVTFARARLAGYKVPRSIVYLDQIPRLGSGKPDRQALSRMEVP